MKTFKQHIKEGGQMGVGTTSHSASVEDTVMRVTTRHFKT